MSTRTRVAVIGGGQSCEHEVSLASAASVRAALDPTAYDVVALTIRRDGLWLGPDERPLGSTVATSLGLSGAARRPGAVRDRPGRAPRGGRGVSRIAGLDVLRGIAVGLVMLQFHLLWPHADLASALLISWAVCFVVGAVALLRGQHWRPPGYVVPVAVAGLALLSVVPLRGHPLTYLAGGPAIAALTAVLLLRRPAPDRTAVPA